MANTAGSLSKIVHESEVNVGLNFLTAFLKVILICILGSLENFLVAFMIYW